MASSKKPMTEKQKKDLIKKTGTGGVRKAGDAIINRQKKLDEMMGAKRKSPAKKKPTKYA